MKKIICTLTLSLMLMTGGTVQTHAKTALVVLAHGSPSQNWNNPALDVERVLRQQTIHGIDYIRVALMEFTEPSIPTVIADCEREGIDTIFALPMFIAPSGHSEEDIPNILGLKYSPDTRRELAEENARIVRTPIHIIVGPTLNYGDILERTMLKRIQEISTDGKNEALLLLAHGDPERIGIWKKMLGRVSKYIKEHTSIDYIDSKLVAMGHYLVNDVTPLLQQAAAKKKRVLVQGIYINTSALGMAEMSGLEKKKSEILKDSSVDVVFSANGILPGSTADVCQWITERTTEWLDSRR